MLIAIPAATVGDTILTVLLPGKRASLSVSNYTWSAKSLRDFSLYLKFKRLDSSGQVYIGHRDRFEVIHGDSDV